MSQSPQTGQFNSYLGIPERVLNSFIKSASQSPQTGQFNSYMQVIWLMKVNPIFSLNPLKRVNSILTLPSLRKRFPQIDFRSQSPQTGQFNSYSDKEDVTIVYCDNVSIPSNGSIQFLQIFHFLEYLAFRKSLNPLKRVNSILTIYRLLVEDLVSH